ncbi:MAG: hypothetical protein O2960_25120 [Verrucomicrobia bacterium]|nr:hypothetical protein [Verrucomicrobiota bacterium]
MDAQITAALITAVAGAAGGILALVIPNTRWFERLTSKHGKHSLLGTWISEWGALPRGPVQHKELLTITKHRGEHIAGYITRDVETEHRWLVEGRYDGRFLQLLYFPAPDSEDSDFLGHGCYFFERSASGTFVGYSTGYGTDDNDPTTEDVTTDFHTIKRKP